MYQLKHDVNNMFQLIHKWANGRSFYTLKPLKKCLLEVIAPVRRPFGESLEGFRYQLVAGDCFAPFGRPQ